VATTRAVASRRAVGDAEGVRVEDLRSAVTVAPVRRLIVLCVDLSGSMGAEERARAATGAALGLLTDAYQHRHRVALVGFSGSGAEVLLAPTSSVEVARNRLSSLRTGGSTPLAEGLRTATALALRYREPTPGDLHQAVLVVLTDGRATGDADALGAALEAGAEVRRRGVTALVLDCETGRTRLGLAARLAEAMGAQLVPAAVLEPLDLPAVIRSSLAP
jgi:magnesium chelatase subunit D